MVRRAAVSLERGEGELTLLMPVTLDHEAGSLGEPDERDEAALQMISDKVKALRYPHLRQRG